MADYKGLTSEFALALRKLVAASGGRIWINSGFRSVERQARLFAAAVKKYGSEAAARKWVAPPGKSHHNMGIAADLGGDLKLAHQLAEKFGLHFPMSWEPWHIEPAGTRQTKDSQTTPPDGAFSGAHPAPTDYAAILMDVFGFNQSAPTESMVPAAATDAVNTAAGEVKRVQNEVTNGVV